MCVRDGVSSVLVALLQDSGFTVTTPSSTCAQWRRFAALRPTSSSTPSEYLRTKTGHYRSHGSVESSAQRHLLLFRHPSASGLDTCIDWEGGSIFCFSMIMWEKEVSFTLAVL